MFSTKFNFFSKFGGILLSLSVICSCSQSNFEIDTTSSKLIDDLEDFNYQMAATVTDTKNFGRFCAIAGADFIAGYEGARIGAKVGFRVGMLCGGKGLEGALIGGGAMGLVCGIGGSYTASCGTKATASKLDCTQLLSMSESALVEVDMIRDGINAKVYGSKDLKLPQSSIDIGILHNHILSSIIEKTDISTSSQLAESSIESTILHSNEFIESADDMITKIENCGVVIDKDGIPDKVMNLYQQIFNSCSNSYENIVTCINNYYSIIEGSSELTEDEKQSIYIGLSVSLYSLNFWNEHGYYPQN